MLKASQNRMNRAALSEAFTSRTPAPKRGLLAITPTGLPMIRMKATTIFLAQYSWGSNISWLSATAAMTFFISYARDALSGITVSNSGHSLSALSVQGAIGWGLLQLSG